MENGKVVSIHETAITRKAMEDSLRDMRKAVNEIMIERHELPVGVAIGVLEILKAQLLEQMGL